MLVLSVHLGVLNRGARWGCRKELNCLSDLLGTAQKNTVCRALKTNTCCFHCWGRCELLSESTATLACLLLNSLPSGLPVCRAAAFGGLWEKIGLGQNSKKLNEGELQIASQKLVPWSEVKDCRVFLINKRDGEMLMATYWWGLQSEKVKEVSVRRRWASFSHFKLNMQVVCVFQQDVSSHFERDCLILHISYEVFQSLQKRGFLT